MSSLFASGSSIRQAQASYAELDAMLDGVDAPSPQYSPSVEQPATDGYDVVAPKTRWPNISKKKMMAKVVKDELAEVAEATEHEVADLPPACPQIQVTPKSEVAKIQAEIDELLAPKYEFAEFVARGSSCAEAVLVQKHDPVVVQKNDPPQSPLPPLPPPPLPPVEERPWRRENASSASDAAASSGGDAGGDASSSVVPAPTMVRVPMEWKDVLYFTDANGREKLNIRDAPFAAPYAGMIFAGYDKSKCGKHINALFPRADSHGVQGARRPRAGGGVSSRQLEQQPLKLKPGDTGILMRTRSIAATEGISRARAWHC